MPSGRSRLTVLGGVAACLLLPLADRCEYRGPGSESRGSSSPSDAVLITAVVTESGGPQSVFIPLYVLLVVAACFALSHAAGSSSRRCAVSSTCCRCGVGPSFRCSEIAKPSENAAVEILTVFMNAGGSPAVGVLTGRAGWAVSRTPATYGGSAQASLGSTRRFRDLISSRSAPASSAWIPPGRSPPSTERRSPSPESGRTRRIDQPWDANLRPRRESRRRAPGPSPKAASPAPRYEFRPQATRRPGGTGRNLLSGRCDRETAMWPAS